MYLPLDFLTHKRIETAVP
uniref:Uncharacterized protein n=1 Tax=Rhizophora mucronata TaxID=61149 RepID=A0A2P2IJX0_RHIMU